VDCYLTRIGITEHFPDNHIAQVLKPGFSFIAKLTGILSNMRSVPGL
jgi:hypothetical protein